MSTEVEDDIQGPISVDDSLAVDATSLIVRNLPAMIGTRNQEAESRANL